MKPVVKEYINVDELEVDIKALKDQGVNVQNIYILTKNSECITNIINNTHVTSISYYPIDSNNIKPNTYAVAVIITKYSKVPNFVYLFIFLYYFYSFSLYRLFLW